jgi:DNA (cytosine-5)-methyltransferase 1
VRAISLFTGAGGLDIGCEQAGFRTVAAVELEPVARATLLENAKSFFPDMAETAVFTDIMELEVPELLDAACVAPGEADLLLGGPPCTPFSKSGYWLEYKRSGSDPKASLLDEYVRFLAEAQPKTFLMENVYGLAYRNQNRPVFDRFLASATRAGYAVDWRVLVAADYGVPQLRQRLVCVGARTDILDVAAANWQLAWPEPIHSGPHETRKHWDPTLAPHRTAGEALAGLTKDTNPPEPEEVVVGTYADELSQVPPGENYLWWTAERGHLAPRFKWRSRYWSFLLKLDPDRPAPTIQGQPGPWVGPFHWDNRRLRVAEVKRLMTFPDNFVTLGSRREQQLQLGNAVPPVFGKVVANALAAELVRLGARDSSLVAAG